MKIKILKESGFEEAMLGLSLSYNVEKTQDEVETIAVKLCNKDGGHNKFLETMIVWLDINAPRYWWQQYDTYRVGTTKQSGSTMHTITKKPLTQKDFETEIPIVFLDILNAAINNKDFDKLKNILPEGFLQRRIVCTNYKTIRNMIIQRKTHKLKEWSYFCDIIKDGLKYNKLLGL